MNLSFWTKCSLVAGSLLLGLILAEIIVRVAAPQILRLPYQDRVDGVRALRPGIQGRLAVPGLFDTTVTINGQRFRGKSDVTRQPAEGVDRIAFLGDSFVFGWGVENDETLPAQLERTLNSRVTSAEKRYEVINAGFPGHYLGEKLLWYDVWVDDFQPSTVVLEVLADDVDTDSGREFFSIGDLGELEPTANPNREGVDSEDPTIERARRWAPISLLRQRSHLVTLVGSRVKRLLAGAGAQPGSDLLGPSAHDRFENVGLPLLRKELLWLDRRVRDRGGRLLLVYIPIRAELYRTDERWEPAFEWRAERIRESLHVLSESEGLELLDLTEPIRDEIRHNGAALYYSGLDSHPTPVAYELMARRIAEVVDPPAAPASPIATADEFD